MKRVAIFMRWIYFDGVEEGKRQRFPELCRTGVPFLEKVLKNRDPYSMI